MDFIFTILFLSFSIVVFLKLTKKTPKPTQNPTPPSPWKLPLIGNIHHLITTLPHQKLRQLAHKYGPLFQLQLGETKTIIISSPEIAELIMKTNDVIFSQRPNLLVANYLSYNSKDIIFARYGNYWRQMRKICTTELLSAKRVHSFRSIRKEEIQNMIKTINSKNGSVINLSEMLFSLTYGMTSRSAFGGKVNDQETFISIAQEMTKIGSGLSLEDMFPSSRLVRLCGFGFRMKLQKIRKTVDKMLVKIMEEHKERRKNGGGEVEEDFVDVLLRLQQDGGLEVPLSDDNIKAVILDIFSAGSETSSTLVEWAMSELLRNPGLMKKAQSEVRQVFNTKGNVDESSLHELKFLGSVIKETLRLHPPVPLLIPRECDKTCMVNGYEIEAKSKVIINAWAINRDPIYWTQPETFLPERFLDSPIDFRGTDFEYIPFGAGRRICPGILFALPASTLPLAQLLYHFDWKIGSGKKVEELDMSEGFGVSMRRKNDLFLIAVPYDLSNLN